MAFFKRRDKQLAREPKLVLQDCYKNTEIGLQKAVASGDEKAMKEAMRKHRDVEYAMLYQNTPEYKMKQKVIISKNKSKKNQIKRRNYGNK